MIIWCWSEAQGNRNIQLDAIVNIESVIETQSDCDCGCVQLKLRYIPFPIESDVKYGDLKELFVDLASDLHHFHFPSNWTGFE